MTESDLKSVREPKRRGRRESHPLVRAGSLLLGLGLVVIKLYTLAHLIHDGRVVVYVIFGFTALHGFYRGRPLTCSLAVAVVVAEVVGAHPLGAAIGLGAAVFVGLGAVCFLGGFIATRFDGRSDGVFGGGWLS